MVFTEQQKIKIVQFWYESKSYAQVCHSFCCEFNVHTQVGPKNNAIKKIVKHFEDKGTIRKSYKGNSGRPATIINCLNFIVGHYNIRQSKKK